MRRILLLLAFILASCGPLPAPPAPGGPPLPDAGGPRPSPEQAVQSFAEVSRAVGPRAVEECRRRTSGVNCDFRIVVDSDPRAPANAYQSRDKQGRPVITFTAAMIADARNADELAFVMGHEAAHHIRGHLDRQAVNAAAGAAIFAELATLTGAGSVQTAQQLGAAVGARTFSKDFELEADELGTVITYRAGYDPLVGARFFTRIPDPGNRFLGSHPPNAERIDTVRRTARQLGIAP
ncbi:Peptidase family M48 [Cribrihabitans marinus]|uniref:Peptidase family M48 n=1 Tax=Cribrihabitans marinus TaxID=1227549 RepID=A0A1H6STL1_9RHOB|nr:M48 family metallopeptidase [Cribrihabitans marinus]GGH22984.1 peptidase M48 [Cribrihabitans marinus]SEI70216.1 Peptidase family M48 [Cribrihabitans marinus]